MLNQQLESMLTAPGSTLYYALRRVPDSHRIPCLGLFGLYNELRELMFNKSETIYVQFGWWYEELERMLTGKSRHPVTQALSTWPHCPQAQPLDWIAKLEPLVGRFHINDEHELLEFCSTLSAPLRAVHHLLGDLEPNGDRSPIGDYINDTSVAYLLFDFLQNLGQYLRDDIAPIPQSELDDSQIQASDLLRPEMTPAFLYVMKTQYNRVSNILAQSSSKLPAREISKQHVALTITAIHKATLREIQHSNYDVVSNYIDITPFRKAWIAWHTYQKAMRRSA